MKNFPLQHWLRSTVIAIGSLLVLFMLLFWIPLDMPIKFTLSWMKGAQTIEATTVKQLEKAGVRVGDTLHLSGKGMCNIHSGATWSGQSNSPFMPFDCSQIIWNDAPALPLPESDLVNKAMALSQAVNRQLHPKPEDDSRVSASLRSAIQKSGMVLLDDFGDIVLKTADLCAAEDECVRLKNALVNLGNSKDWNALVKRANAGKLDGVNVLLRPVSAESLENLVTTSTAPFISRETARAAQSLNSPAPGGFLIASDEGSELVDQPGRQRRCMTIPRRNSGAPSSVWRKRSCRRHLAPRALSPACIPMPTARSISACIVSPINPAGGVTSAPRC